MKLRKLGTNHSELILTGCVRVLLSHEKPVASLEHGKLYKTAEKQATTTNRHIDTWLNGAIAETKPQNHFNTLLLVK